MRKKGSVEKLTDKERREVVTMLCKVFADERKDNMVCDVVYRGNYRTYGGRVRSVMKI